MCISNKYPTCILSLYLIFHETVPIDTTSLENKSANALALCHPPSASFCSVLAVQWNSRIFTHDRYNIPSDILIEFEVNLGIIIEKYA